MWWRRSWFSLKGKGGVQGQIGVLPTSNRFHAPPGGSVQQPVIRLMEFLTALDRDIEIGIWKIQRHGHIKVRELESA
jgi:hypothetical protein